MSLFLGKNGETPTWVVDFSGKRHIPKNHGNRLGFYRKKLQQQRQTLEIVEVFACENKNLRHLRRFRIFEFFFIWNFSFFHLFFLFFFFLFSDFFFFLFFLFSFCCIIFFFQSSEQTPKPVKIVEQLVPFVKMTISFCENSIFGSLDRRGVKKGPFEGGAAFMFFISLISFCAFLFLLEKCFFFKFNRFS